MRRASACSSGAAIASRMAVVRRHRAVLDEVPPALLQRGEVAGVVVDVRPGRLAQALDGVGPARRRGLQVADPGGTWAPPGCPPPGPRPAGRGRRDRRRGRRWSPSPRSRTGAAAPGAGGPGAASCSAIWSYSASAFSALGRSRTPKISPSSLSNQYRTGVPRSRCQFSHSSRHTSRARSSGSGPSPTPSRSRLDAARVQQPRHVVVGLDEQARGVGERLVVHAGRAGRRARAGRRSAGPGPPRTAGGRRSGPRARRAAAGPGAQSGWPWPEVGPAGGPPQVVALCCRGRHCNNWQLFGPPQVAGATIGESLKP